VAGPGGRRDAQVFGDSQEELQLAKGGMHR
jgi:hypothetical protein